MKNYLELIKLVKNNGSPKEDRTKTGTISIFGSQERYNLEDEFPIITTKKLILMPWCMNYYGLLRVILTLNI